MRRKSATAAPAASDAADDGGMRPVVRLPRSGPSGVILALCALAAAIVLFTVLEMRRTARVEPAVRPQAADAGYALNAPPPLQIPPEPTPVAPLTEAPAQVAPPNAMQLHYYGGPPAPLAAAPPPVYAPPPQPIAALPPNRNSSAVALVIDTTSGSAGAVVAAPTGGAQTALPGATVAATARVRSGMLANRANTVQQGTLIPAVLETAFDSTRPGFARAIVSRDVRGFDGSKILIPRGSRLVGQYQSDAGIGQKRAVINWTRLVRPDGAVIAIESPAVDPVGRGGVRASVNNHIPERLFDALLQSTFQIGSALAMRATTNSVVVALPNSVQSAGPQVGPATVVPTLKVPAATSISIFVVRDLEFDGETQR